MTTEPSRSKLAPGRLVGRRAWRTRAELARHNKNQFGWTYQELRLENKKTVPQPERSQGGCPISRLCSGSTLQSEGRGERGVRRRQRRRQTRSRRTRTLANLNRPALFEFAPALRALLARGFFFLAIHGTSWSQSECTRPRSPAFIGALRYWPRLMASGAGLFSFWRCH